ncbi:hypothetical protein Daesc_002465 [Daldinia eschscholtzii]|uniref:CENP-V/GFA domain-containing protein n=1 Tax=Daldinia eschscholtzii TaxID=292717 RepID=A0AAX6MX41_9PEZI
MTTTTDKSKPNFPLAGLANDGWSKEDEATATCFCGAVQLAFHLRGRDNLTKFGPQAHTVASGKGMANYFCSTCGTLMYRVGEAFPGMSILRLGTIDDFHLHETKMRPTVEYFIESRVGWLKGVEGIKQVEGFPSH